MATANTASATSAHPALVPAPVAARALALGRPYRDAREFTLRCIRVAFDRLLHVARLLDNLQTPHSAARPHFDCLSAQLAEHGAVRCHQVRDFRGSRALPPHVDDDPTRWIQPNHTDARTRERQRGRLVAVSSKRVERPTDRELTPKLDRLPLFRASMRAMPS